MREFRPDEMAVAIKQSRELLPHALDALCAVITEAIGKAPNRAQVEYVSLFWLMHACDKAVVQHLEPNCTVAEAGASLQLGVTTLRSRLLSVTGNQASPVQVFNPYLKSNLRN